MIFYWFCFRNFFPRHQAALQEPDPSPTLSKSTPQQPIQGPQTLGHSAGSFVGLGHGTSQALGGGYPQAANPPTTVAANQSTSYIGGRLTPQSMQQGVLYNNLDSTCYKKLGNKS